MVHPLSTHLARLGRLIVYRSPTVLPASPEGLAYSNEYRDRQAEARMTRGTVASELRVAEQ